MLKEESMGIKKSLEKNKFLLSLTDGCRNGSFHMAYQKEKQMVKLGKSLNTRQVLEWSS